MKKAFVMVLAMLLMMSSAMACEGVLPNIETSETAMSGPAWWVLSENHHVAGKLTEQEKVAVLNVQNVTGTYITGAVDTGLIREKAEMRYMLIDSAVCGLTKIETAVSIREEYQEAVKEIILRRMGDGEMTAANIIACTICRTQETVTHHFFSSQVDRLLVGTVIVNGGKAAIDLYLGDWNGDGLNELGFAAGYIIQQYKPQPEPQTSAKETKACAQRKTCVTVVQVNWQINVNSTVRNVQNVNVNTGCNKNGAIKICVKE